MDGNNSLKRVEGSGRVDGRTFISNYLIPPAEIDRFKDDVRNQPGRNNSRVAQAPADIGIPPHGYEQTVCSDNWVAANAVSKDTLQLFEQTGVFISVCRHGFVQTLVEMRRSGELFVMFVHHVIYACSSINSAKYGLGTLNEIIDMYGDDQCMGYDIACSHITTVAASSIGEKACTRWLLLAVNAFHGYAHNLLCQLRNHPLYILGLGLEDLETCEQVFSASNAVAWVVRHSSYFHWLQYIDLHYRQWDEDKYFELSMILFMVISRSYQQITSVTFS
jgi:Kyakuja-Dileera-Zisupton transposase